jgi:hypothetical protein
MYFLVCLGFPGVSFGFGKVLGFQKLVIFCSFSKKFQRKGKRRKEKVLQ